MNEENILAEMETLFLVLADKTRLRLLNLMRGDEVCVNSFTEVLGENQPKISRHLAYLRNAEIVEARREGKWIYYKIAEPKNKFAAFLLNEILNWLETQNKMKAERKKLADVRSTNTSEAIFHSSESNIFVKANTSNARQELETFLL